MPNSLTKAARLYGDALGHRKDEIAELAKLFALLGRIRLVSPRTVVTAAERSFDMIIQAYLGSNRTLRGVGRRAPRWIQFPY